MLFLISWLCCQLFEIVIKCINIPKQNLGATFYNQSTKQNKFRANNWNLKKKDAFKKKKLFPVIELKERVSYKWLKSQLSLWKVRWDVDATCTQTENKWKKWVSPEAVLNMTRNVHVPFWGLNLAIQYALTVFVRQDQSPLLGFEKIINSCLFVVKKNRLVFVFVWEFSGYLLSLKFARYKILSNE